MSEHCFVPLDDFVAETCDYVPEPILGTTDDKVVPCGGLWILSGKTGKGKTTLAVDAAFHLAAGIPWLGMEVPYRNAVLLIENEGPREPFRQKLEAKRETWTHSFADQHDGRGEGGIFVYDGNWGSLRLTDEDARQRLREFIALNSIDIVIGDPLNMLGVQGVGSPGDTREFVILLRDCGLGETAFCLLHHVRHNLVKKADGDELDEISGAWAPHADAVMSLAMLEGNRSRLSFPKLRWAKERHKPLVLGFDPESEGFEVVAEVEGAEDRDYVTEIAGYLVEHPATPIDEIAKAIEAQRRRVKVALETSGRFERAQTPPGRHRNAKCWSLAEEPVPGSGTGWDGLPQVERDGIPVRTHPLPVREGFGDGFPPTTHPEDPSGIDTEEIERLAEIARGELRR